MKSSRIFDTLGWIFKRLYTMKAKQIRRLITFITFLLLGMNIFQWACQGESPPLPSEVVYKQVDTCKLILKFHYPPNMDRYEEYPAIVFFFGGGWKSSKLKQFEPQARYFADLGMIGILADYRVESRHGTTPFEAVKDAKSAIRFLRQNAEDLQIDPVRIVAAGGSAGGHLAAATGTLPGLDEKHEDLRVSSIPDAMVLFNPVFDNGPEGYGYERIGERYEEISPLHNIGQGTPPTIVFLGTEDRLIPVSTAEQYRQKMADAGNRCELFVYEGQKHGFFNYKHPEYYKKTTAEAARFLASLGYLENRNHDADRPEEDLALHDLNKLIQARELYSQEKEPYLSEVQLLEKEAEGLLQTSPVSVMDKKMIPPSGDKHDYYSLGVYWWPDPDKEDGVPYIRHDGVRNPEIADYDGPASRVMCETTSKLALAWFFTGNKAYAMKASEFIRVWFLDPETKMNPHLEYGQAIPGRTEGRGIGIIETGRFIDVVEAVGLLKGSGALTTKEKKDILQWFKSYNNWLVSSQNGWDERMWHNNHGSSYDSQVAAFSIFTGQDSIARMILDSVKIKRIDLQFEADGSQPFELERTKAMGYSIYNLKHLYHNAIMAERYNIDLWNYTNPKGASILTGTKYLIPFITGEKEFPYQQLGGLEEQRENFLSLLLIAGSRFDDPAINEFMDNYPDPVSIPGYNNLLFPDIK
ncbi:alginate lyase family protein [Bacteroidota bacterium]